MTTTAMPNPVELAHRMHRVAKMVCTVVDDPPTEGAVYALGMWEVFTGIEDAERAIAYARRVAADDWAARYLTGNL